ncbi:MAG: ribbon-helix-helix protein, CopG family [Thermofilaceae archaeon]
MSEKGVKVVKQVKVKLPLEVYNKILEKVRRKGYMNVSEYVRELLRRELEEG